MITSAYRRLVPERIRHSRVVRQLRAAVVGGRRGHDLIYNAEYYAETVAEAATASADVMASSIVSDLAPNAVFDVGCGTGALLAALGRLGCPGFGVEYSKAALRYCREQNLDVTRFDIENDRYENPRDFDVAVSMEVAEHIPESRADRYLDLLAGAGRAVVFTAAPPGQGGNDHVNERPAAYWIAKFADRGFQLNDELTRSWHDHWRRSEHVRSWYYQNLMVFRRAGDADPSR